MPSEERSKKGKPTLRKNPCVDFKDESNWQAIAPKGWHFNPKTSYCCSDNVVYLCLEKNVEEGDSDG